MRNRKAVVLFVMVVALVGFQGCGVVGSNLPADNSAYQTSPLEKAKLTSVYFLETYKTQFKDTQAMGEMAKAGTLAPGQLEVYRTKRQLLITVEPLVKAFADLVANGTIPAPGREQEINNILNQLLSTASKVGR